jgi:hypothetical protein
MCYLNHFIMLGFDKNNVDFKVGIYRLYLRWGDDPKHAAQIEQYGIIEDHVIERSRPYLGRFKRFADGAVGPSCSLTQLIRCYAGECAIRE